MRFPTLLHTLRHARLSQLIWRIRYTIERKRTVRPAPWQWAETNPPPVRNDFPDLPLFHRPSGGPGIVERLCRGTFQHLNRSCDLKYGDTDWQLGPIADNRLWSVTLHYHAWADELAELATSGGTEAGEAGSLFEHYIGGWIARCPVDAPGARSLAWNAYAIATRITWWIRAYRRLQTVAVGVLQQGNDAFLRSLWEQASYLRDHLEWDLRANHLLRDAVGLAWAGRFFTGERPAEWLRTATKLAVEQAAEQVLPDGGHFERSPMYHLHVMEDLLSLALLVEDPNAKARLRDTWRRMGEYASWVRHPDGQIPLFNDAALNGAAEPGYLLHLGQTQGIEVDAGPRRGGHYFPETGLAVWHGDPWSVFFDAGPVGPDYQPGHAHADTLSIECSYRGRRLIVDPGTIRYDHDTARQYDRSTAAHNTVEIDGTDSSEVWHIFRVGRRGYPTDVKVEFSNGGMIATAAHTGYKHLPGRPRHTRRITIGLGGRLTIEDSVDGRRSHTINGGYLLAPGWEATPAGNGWTLRNGSDAVQVRVHGPASLNLSIEPRPYHPEFGMEVITNRLNWQYDGPVPVEVITYLEPL